MLPEADEDPFEDEPEALEDLDPEAEEDFDDPEAADEDFDPEAAEEDLEPDTEELDPDREPDAALEPEAAEEDFDPDAADEDFEPLVADDDLEPETAELDPDREPDIAVAEPEAAEDFPTLVAEPDFVPDSWVADPPLVLDMAEVALLIATSSTMVEASGASCPNARSLKVRTSGRPHSITCSVFSRATSSR